MKVIIKIFKVLFSLVLVAFVFIGLVNLIPVYQLESTPFSKTTRTLISAHRGGGELNPENTKMAFDHVIKETSYVDIVEFDIRMTKDEKAVIIHDKSINKFALDEDKEEMLLTDYTYEELKEYNLGYNFIDREGNRPYKDLSINEAKEKGLTLMTLEEFLSEYKEVRDFLIYLEIKDKGENAIKLAKLTLELFSQNEYSWWKNRTMIISSDDDAIDYIASNDPSQYVGAVGFKIATAIAGDIFNIEPLFKPNFHCVQTAMKNKLGPITINSATKSFVDSVHKHNQSIAYWDAKTKEDMELLVSLGADVLTVDAPDVLANILNVEVK